jgi:hypothetical protein
MRACASHVARGAERSVVREHAVGRENVQMNVPLQQVAAGGDRDHDPGPCVGAHLSPRQARRLDRRPRFIVTTGNVVFIVVRMQALLGHFNYGKRGILDMTHTRLYTFKTLRRLFEQCGFIVEEVKGIPAPFPVAIGMNPLSRLMVRLNSLLIRLSKGLFSYQIFMRVAPMASVDALLDDSIGGSRDRMAAALASGSIRDETVVAAVGTADPAPRAAQPTSTR